jgi:LacI family transcriptional regulator
MPTQHDVASLAKVSTASVSRYLRDPESVKPEISERIRSAIAELDYQLDYSAQALKTGRFSHVGIIASGVAPFFLEMYHAIQARLGELGYFTTLFFTRDMETSTEDAQDPLPLILQKKQLDGVIFFPTMTPEDKLLVKRLKSWKKPYLLVNHPMKQKRLPQMYFDNVQGGRTAALAFLERGMLAPRDYSIIGFDDNPEFAPFLTPPLTSFTQPVKTCGQQAAEKIVQLINHETDPFEHRVFQPAFQLRESLGPVPGQ